jgi:hypothetical protein
LNCESEVCGLGRGNVAGHSSRIGVVVDVAVWIQPLHLLVYRMAMLGFALWIAVGISGVVGYVLVDYSETIYSVALAQPIVAIIDLQALKPLFVVGLCILSFLVSVVFGISGVFLRERLHPLREFRLVSIPLPIGLVIQSLIIAIPVSMPRSLAMQGLQFSPGDYLVSALPILLILGLGIAAIGTISPRHFSIELGGLLMITSFVLALLTISSITFVGAVLDSEGGIAGADQIMAQFQVAMWCLYPSIIIPGLVFLRLLFHGVPKRVQVCPM